MCKREGECVHEKEEEEEEEEKECEDGVGGSGATADGLWCDEGWNTSRIDDKNDEWCED